ncbi:hypothetical protein FSP39_010080 [Pinctada imbricata]|uniref:PD-(D/E)XK endonuclease-like domain-containing protein n=1 Tax=Pinctada imbricata TaxID=66713 RepID=A0AA88XW71_PINIB|nr:hypothetical protein FSP39_010080 [Pinctada imbricata]
MIDEALFGPIINIKKESNTTKSSVSKQTKDSEGIKTNSNLKTKVTKVSTNSHQTSSVNKAKSTIAASANDTEGIKKNSNSKANAKVSSYSQQTSTENDTKSTIAVGKKKAAIKALDAVIGSEASSKTAGTRIKEERTESKSSVKVPIKEGDKLCVKLEQNPHKVKTSDSKNDTVEKEIKKKPKVDAKLVKGLIHAAEVDKQKKEMLENLGTVVDRQSNALVLLANYETLANGRNLHTCIERFLDGESIENIIPWDDNKGHWDSLKSVLPSFSYVYGKEEMVVHNVLHYRGKFDCVAQYKDSICVIDWKTSKKPKPRLSDTFDHPLQLAAYAGALNQSQYLKDRKVSKTLLYNSESISEG